MPSSFRRHFLPWDRPWLPQVAAWLADGWNGGGPLNLSGVLAVVPTRQSGRRLREALAEHAAARGGAVFAPRVQTPDTLLAAGSAAPDVASRLEALLAWADVLRATDPAEVSEVFPVPPARRDFPWAWQLAENLFRLQTQLTESGLAFADVVERAGPEFPEAARWRQLAALEAAQIEKLATFGKREPHAARRAFAAQPPLPAGIRRIVVLAVPDPIPLAIDVLRQWARELPVDVVVYAPREEAAAFDDAGRPVVAAWEKRRLEIDDFPHRVHLCANPAAEAGQAAEVARSYGHAEGIVAFGLADPAVLPLLENELSRAGIASYNPEGRALRAERLYGLLAALAAFARNPSFESVATLARCPDVLAALQTHLGPGFSAAHFLADLDALRARHLPETLAAALARANAAVAVPKSESARKPGADAQRFAQALDFLQQLHDVLTRGDFPRNASAALQRIFAGRSLDLGHGNDARLAEAADAWREVMAACAAAQAQFPDVRNGDWWEVALRLFAEARRPEDKPAGALELLWEDAPHLIVAGLNDGLVPEAIVGDAFLPESLREKLGLKTNGARFARDAYLLQAIAAWRVRGGDAPALPQLELPLEPAAPMGQLDLFFAKTSAVGDPLKPSRLLLRCADHELPARIDLLFRPAEAMRPNLAWRRAWQLTPREVAPPARVAVTGLRTWLACPFRFYLAHVLRMEPVEPAKSELDARDFGTLCHAALEAMALEPALRDCTDEKTLREFLLAELSRAARERFGDALTLPLVVQIESARQRLAKFAAVHARERAAGWIVDRVEWAFSLPISGLEVRGKIDRIDRHESGAWRVLDYKTADTAKPPHKAHVRPFRAGDERLPAWMRFTLNNRECVWADLQLPVYLRALAADGLPAQLPACGYITLPKAIGETGVSLWTELSPALLEAAEVCADGVAAAIRAGEFWPPAELPPDRDAFAALFHHGAEDSVLWTRPAGVPSATEEDDRLEAGGALR